MKQSVDREPALVSQTWLLDGANAHAPEWKQVAAVGFQNLLGMSECPVPRTPCMKFWLWGVSLYPII